MSRNAKTQSAGDSGPNGSANFVGRVSRPVQTCADQDGTGVPSYGCAFQVVRCLAICIVLHSTPLTARAQEQSIPQPDVVVPYSPEQPALRADQVFIRHEDFLKLYQQANPEALHPPAINPLGSAVVATFLKAGTLTQVDGTKYVLSFEGRFVVSSDSEQAVNVPLPIGPVAIRSLQVDGKDGSVQPLVVGAAGSEIPSFAAQQIVTQQQAINTNSVAPMPTDVAAYTVEVTGKGFHVVDLKFDISALVEGELGRADLPLRSPAAGTLEWTLPADGLDAKVNGRTNVYRREGRTIILPIAQLSTVRLQWLPTVQKVAGDVVYHAAVSSAMSVQDSGIQLRTTVTVNCRQGEISELDVTIPEGYSVQSVTGDDIAGWTAQSTDATRSVKLQFRRSVNDATKVTMQLYAPVPTIEALASLTVPIAMVRGASRDTGTVILKTGPQFQVRSDSLSAVTQINASEAAAPNGHELPGRPMLAWRYTRHPASVTVKVMPTADELTVESTHAVRLEEQRQLWSSRMTLRVSGAPRSRIDVTVPKSFLALDVTSTGLKDWYFTDAADGDNANADSRILSIQLQDAHTGALQIAIQGQMNRDTDRSLLKLTPPAVLNATKVTSELAVWLDAASESAGLENGSDWSVKSAANANSAFQEVSATAPSLAFQSNAVRQGSVTMKLRQAVSTLIAESVTVTNVTETALELTLALNWQINRAAADHFAVELPTSVAAIMSFDVPGQRRVTKDDLGDGRTRVTMQLQQPVTDRLFVLGTASLPLPADKVIRAEVPNVVVPQNAPSRLSGQQHFWVLVNQSNGLLQPTAEQADDKVSPDQITTQIPPQLLQQAVAVKKLRPETAVWNLVYPEQFQVAPAVVNLATHTTVISDDGSWRSRHVLQVTNESRQFLPVVLPNGSRLMYCLVQGRPSRVVIHGEGEDTRHLIPIPQSGALASGFEVEFALAGRFNDSAALIRREFTSSRLQIPVPAFPEFRDDSEFGIQVSRNRWSVYVPESWRATLVEDPNATNVVRAAATELQDLSLMCEVEQASTLVNNFRSAKTNFARRKAISEVQNKTELLRRYSGNDRGVEQQRGDVLNKLSDIVSNGLSSGGVSGYPAVDSDADGVMQYIQPAQSQAGSVITGNSFLFEQEQGQNGLNYFNKNAFIDNNRKLGGVQFDRSQQDEKSNRQSDQPSAGEGDTNFRFGLTIQEFEAEDASKWMEKSGKEAAGGKSESDKAPGEKSDDEARQRLVPPPSRAAASKKVQSGRELAESKDVAEPEGLQKRSQLMQRRTGQPQAGKPVDQLMDEIQLQQQAVPQQMDNTLSLYVQQNANMEGRTATPTGLLSLKFDIPTDGQQIDFLRVGGNPELTLDVRSSDSVTKGTGVIWLILCGLAIMMLAGPGSKGQVFIFCQRLSLILAVSGLVAWLVTTGDLKGFGLFLCVAAAIALAITTTISQLRNPARKAESL